MSAARLTAGLCSLTRTADHPSRPSERRPVSTGVHLGLLSSASLRDSYHSIFDNHAQLRRARLVVHGAAFLGSEHGQFKVEIQKERSIAERAKADLIGQENLAPR